MFLAVLSCDTKDLVFIPGVNIKVQVLQSLLFSFRELFRFSERYLFVFTVYFAEVVKTGFERISTSGAEART